MRTLSNLQDTHRKRKSSKRVGRGVGSGKGKTSGRGEKGQGARSGARRRFGYEGGGIPLHMRLPKRGFKRGFLVKKLDSINLWQIDELFSDSEKVDLEALIKKGFIGTRSVGFKVLGQGEITKKVVIVADDYSESAKQKLDQASVEYQLVS